MTEVLDVDIDEKDEFMEQDDDGMKILINLFNLCIIS